jgi:uncharacterized integral membrane protein
MRLILWTLKALVFFTLFAFALNNQHPASVKWFFGVEWQAPMVFVVLASFAAGCVLGVLAMVPGRWRGRGLRGRVPVPEQQADPGAMNSARRQAGASVDSADSPVSAAPPRDGL